MKIYGLIYLCVAAVASAIPFPEIVEAEAQVYVGVRSIPEIREKWNSHSLTELWQDEQLQAFLAPLLEADSSDGSSAETPDFGAMLEDEFGLTADELYAMLPGQAALAFYNLTEMVCPAEAAADLALIVECSASPEEVERLMQLQFERNTEAQKALNASIEHEMLEESFMGETLYFDETFDGVDTYIEDGYSLVDGIFILASTKERLRAVVEAIKAGPQQSLAETDTYIRSRETSGRGDLSVYINLEVIMSVLHEHWLGVSLPQAWTYAGVNSQSLSKALALDSMRALYLDADLIDDGALFHGGCIYSEKRGIASLVAYGDGGVPSAGYVPEGVFASSVSRFDISAMLKRLEQLLATASPTIMPMVEMSFLKLKSDTGVDLRTALLENFGDEAVSVSLLQERGSADSPLLLGEDAYIFDLKDGEELSRALEAFKDLAPPVRSMIEAQEYQGHTIYSFNPGAGSFAAEAENVSMSYVVTRDKLIFSTGSGGLLQLLLTRMANRSEGFWQSSEVVRLFERIAQPGAVSRSYINLEQLVVPMLRAMVEHPILSGLSTHLDESKIPTELDVPYRLISEVNEASDGLYSRTLFIKVGAGE